MEGVPSLASQIETSDIRMLKLASIQNIDIVLQDSHTAEYHWICEICELFPGVSVTIKLEDNNPRMFVQVGDVKLVLVANSGFYCFAYKSQRANRCHDGMVVVLFIQTMNEKVSFTIKF